jgi:hypothetical protein
MTRWFDRLNLAPTERRMAIVGLCVMGLLFNYWFIWPYFAEWDIMVRERTKLEGQKQIYFKEVSKKSTLEKLLKELEGAGGQVLPEEQANRVQQGITAAAATNGVSLGRVSPQIASLRMSSSKDTNFFDEQIVIVDLTSKEEGFVNFLYALGSSDSMIRVRDLSRLRLDNISGQYLSASVTFVASFQKKPKAAAPAGPGPKATESKSGAKASGGALSTPASGSAAKPKSSTNAAATSRVTGTNAPTKK